MKSIYLFLILFMISSCCTSKSGLKTGTATEDLPNDTIVFISMNMKFDSLANENNIEVIQIIKTPGIFKKHLIKNIEGENQLACIVQNEKTGMKDSFYVEHPLYKEIEYLDEKNQFAKRNINLKESEFFVRFEKKNYNSLVINENTPLIKNNKLTVIKL